MKNNDIHRVIRHDKRKGKSYLCYVVNCGGRKKIFQVGDARKITARQDLHAFRTASLFKSCSGYAKTNNLVFDEEVFKSWKGVRLYDETDLGLFFPV